MIFGEEKVTTGAASDIKMVTDVARRMVTEWGMSDKLGFLAYGAPEQEVFLGHSVTQRKDISDATAKVIDEEIRLIVDRAYSNARDILTRHMDQLHRLAKGLLEFETLSGEEVRAICNGEPINRDKTDEDHAKGGGRRASVPTTGGPGTDSAGGIAPEPQPGV